jgi:predicted ATP-grasp superfamily ATP-dependent carboligase
MGVNVPGLAVIRSLGRRGIPVVGVDARRSPMAYSRHLRFRLAPDVDEGDALRDYYLALGRELDGPAVLLPTADEQVEFLAEHADALAERYRFFIADRGLIETVVSKHGLARLAAEHGFAVPATATARSREELAAHAGGLRFPCVVKPEFNYVWTPAALASVGLPPTKAVPVESPAELFEWYERLEGLHPGVVVQEMIVGPDRNHYDYHLFADPDGRITGEFLGIKKRLAPPHFGVGTYVESVCHDDVIRAARRIIRSVGYRGVANLQFKRDERDGVPYLMDFNPRFNLWTGLAVACGVDLPYLYWSHCLGRSYAVPRGWYVGRHWLHLVRDVKSMRTYASDGSYSWGEWLRSVLRPSIGAVFAVDDPLPGVVELARAASKAVGGR